MLINEERFNTYTEYFSSKKSVLLESNREYFSSRVESAKELSGLLRKLFTAIETEESLRGNSRQAIAERIRNMSTEQYCAFEYELTNDNANLAAKYLAAKPLEFDQNWRTFSPIDEVRFEQYVDHLNENRDDLMDRANQYSRLFGAIKSSKEANDLISNFEGSSIVKSNLRTFFGTVNAESFDQLQRTPDFTKRFAQMSMEQLAAFECELTKNPELALRYLMAGNQKFMANWQRIKSDSSQLALSATKQLQEFHNIKSNATQRGATLILGAYVGKGKDANPDIGRDGNFYKQVALHLAYKARKYPGSLAELLYYMNGDFSNPNNAEYGDIREIGHQLPEIPEGKTDLEEIPVPVSAGARIKKYLQNASNFTDTLTVYLIVANVADDPYQRVGYAFCAAPLAKLLRDLEVLPELLFKKVRIKFRCCAAGVNEYEGVTGKFAKDFANAVKMLSGDITDEKAEEIVQVARAKNDRANVKRRVASLEASIATLQEQTKTASNTTELGTQKSQLQSYKQQLTTDERNTMLWQEEENVLLKLSPKPPYEFYLEISVTNTPFWIQEITGSSVFQISQDDPRLYTWGELRGRFKHDYLTTLLLTDSGWMEFKGRKPDITGAMLETKVRSTILSKWINTPPDKVTFVKDPFSAWRGEFTAEVVGVNNGLCYVARINKKRELLIDKTRGKGDELKIGVIVLDLFTQGGGVGQRFSVSAGKENRQITLINSSVVPESPNLHIESPKIEPVKSQFKSARELAELLNIDSELIDILAIDKNKMDSNWQELASSFEEVIRNFPRAHGLCRFVLLGFDKDSVQLLQEFPPTSPERRVACLSRSQFPDVFDNPEFPLANKLLFDFRMNRLDGFEFIRKRPYQELGGGANWLQGDLWMRLGKESQDKLPAHLALTWEKLGESTRAAISAIGEWRDYLNDEEQVENQRLNPLREMINASYEELQIHAAKLAEPFDPDNEEQKIALFEARKAMRHQIERYTRNRLLESAASHSRHHRSSPTRQKTVYTVSPQLAQQIDRYFNGGEDTYLQALENTAKSEGILDASGRGDITRYVFAIANMGIPSGANRDTGTDNFGLSAVRDGVLFWSELIDPYGKQQRIKRAVGGSTVISYEFDSESNSEEKTLALVLNCTHSGEIRGVHTLAPKNPRLDAMFGSLEQLPSIAPANIDDGAVMLDPEVRLIPYGSKIAFSEDELNNIKKGGTLCFVMNQEGNLLVGSKHELLAGGGAGRIGGEFRYDETEKCFYISNISPYSTHLSRTETKHLNNVLPFFNQPPQIKTQARWHAREGERFSATHRSIFKPAISPFMTLTDIKPEEGVAIVVSDNPLIRILQELQILGVVEKVLAEEPFDSIREDFENLPPIDVKHLDSAGFHRYLQFLLHVYSNLPTVNPAADNAYETDRSRVKHLLLVAINHYQDNSHKLTNDLDTIEKFEFFHNLLLAFDAIEAQNKFLEKVATTIATQFNSIFPEELDSADEFHLIVIANRLSRANLLTDTLLTAIDRINERFFAQSTDDHYFSRIGQDRAVAKELAQYSANYFSRRLLSNSAISEDRRVELCCQLVHAISAGDLKEEDRSKAFLQIAEDIVSLLNRMEKGKIEGSCSFENIGLLISVFAPLSFNEHCNSAIVLFANFLLENPERFNDVDTLRFQPLLSGLSQVDKTAHFKSTKSLCGEVRKSIAKAKKAKTSSFPQVNKSEKPSKASSWPKFEKAEVTQSYAEMDSAAIASIVRRVTSEIQSEVIDLSNVRPMTPKHDDYFRRLKGSITEENAELETLAGKLKVISELTREVHLLDSGGMLSELMKEAYENKWVKTTNQGEFIRWLVSEDNWNAINPIEVKNKVALSALIEAARRDISIQNRPFIMDHRVKFPWSGLVKNYLRLDGKRARAFWVDRVMKNSELSKEQKKYLEHIRDMLTDVKLSRLDDVESFDELEKLALSEKIRHQRIVWTTAVLEPRLNAFKEQQKRDEIARRNALASHAEQAKRELEAEEQSLRDKLPDVPIEKSRQERTFDNIVAALKRDGSSGGISLRNQLRQIDESVIDLPQLVGRLIGVNEWLGLITDWKQSLNSSAQSLSTTDLTKLFIADNVQVGKFNATIRAMGKERGGNQPSVSLAESLQGFFEPDHRPVELKVHSLVSSITDSAKWTVFLEELSTYLDPIDITTEKKETIDMMSTELTRWTHGRAALATALQFRDEQQAKDTFDLAIEAVKNRKPFKLAAGDFTQETYDAINFLVHLSRSDIVGDAGIPQDWSAWKALALEKSHEIKNQIFEIRKELAREYLTIIGTETVDRKKAKENANRIIQAIEIQDADALNEICSSIVKSGDHSNAFIHALTQSKTWRIAFLAQNETAKPRQDIAEQHKILDRVDLLNGEEAAIFFQVFKDIIKKLSEKGIPNSFSILREIEARGEALAAFSADKRLTLEQMLNLHFQPGAPDVGSTLAQTKQNLKIFASTHIIKFFTQQYFGVLLSAIENKRVLPLLSLGNISIARKSETGVDAYYQHANGLYQYSHRNLHFSSPENTVQISFGARNDIGDIDSNRASMGLRVKVGAQRALQIPEEASIIFFPLSDAVVSAKDLDGALVGNTTWDLLVGHRVGPTEMQFHFFPSPVGNNVNERQGRLVAICVAKSIGMPQAAIDNAQFFISYKAPKPDPDITDELMLVRQTQALTQRFNTSVDEPFKAVSNEDIDAQYRNALPRSVATILGLPELQLDLAAVVSVLFDKIESDDLNEARQLMIMVAMNATDQDKNRLSQEICSDDRIKKFEKYLDYVVEVNSMHPAASMYKATRGCEDMLGLTGPSYKFPQAYEAWLLSTLKNSVKDPSLLTQLTAPQTVSLTEDQKLLKAALEFGMAVLIEDNPAESLQDMSYGQLKGRMLEAVRGRTARIRNSLVINSLQWSCSPMLDMFKALGEKNFEEAKDQFTNAVWDSVAGANGAPKIEVLITVLINHPQWKSLESALKQTFSGAKILPQLFYTADNYEKYQQVLKNKGISISSFPALQQSKIIQALLDAVKNKKELSLPINISPNEEQSKLILGIKVILTRLSDDDKKNLRSDISFEELRSKALGLVPELLDETRALALQGAINPIMTQVKGRPPRPLPIPEIPYTYRVDNERDIFAAIFFEIANNRLFQAGNLIVDYINDESNNKDEFTQQLVTHPNWPMFEEVSRQIFANVHLLQSNVREKTHFSTISNSKLSDLRPSTQTAIRGLLLASPKGDVTQKLSSLKLKDKELKMVEALIFAFSNEFAKKAVPPELKTADLTKLWSTAVEILDRQEMGRRKELFQTCVEYQIREAWVLDFYNFAKKSNFVSAEDTVSRVISADTKQLSSNKDKHAYVRQFAPQLSTHPRWPSLEIAMSAGIFGREVISLPAKLEKIQTISAEIDALSTVKLPFQPIIQAQMIRLVNESLLTPRPPQPFVAPNWPAHLHPSEEARLFTRAICRGLRETLPSEMVLQVTNENLPSLVDFAESGIAKIHVANQAQLASDFLSSRLAVLELDEILDTIERKEYFTASQQIKELFQNLRGEHKQLYTALLIHHPRWSVFAEATNMMMFDILTDSTYRDIRQKREILEGKFELSRDLQQAVQTQMQEMINKGIKKNIPQLGQIEDVEERKKSKRLVDAIIEKNLLNAAANVEKRAALANQNYAGFRNSATEYVRSQDLDARSKTIETFLQSKLLPKSFFTFISALGENDFISAGSVVNQVASDLSPKNPTLLHVGMMLLFRPAWDVFEEAIKNSKALASVGFSVQNSLWAGLDEQKKNFQTITRELLWINHDDAVQLANDVIRAAKQGKSIQVTSKLTLSDSDKEIINAMILALREDLDKVKNLRYGNSPPLHKLQDIAAAISKEKLARFQLTIANSALEIIEYLGHTSRRPPAVRNVELQIDKAKNLVPRVFDAIAENSVDEARELVEEMVYILSGCRSESQSAFEEVEKVLSQDAKWRSLALAIPTIFPDMENSQNVKNVLALERCYDTVIDPTINIRPQHQQALMSRLYTLDVDAEIESIEWPFQLDPVEEGLIHGLSFCLYRLKHNPVTSEQAVNISYAKLREASVTLFPNVMTQLRNRVASEFLEYAEHRVISRQLRDVFSDAPMDQKRVIALASHVVAEANRGNTEGARFLLVKVTRELATDKQKNLLALSLSQHPQWEELESLYSNLFVHFKPQNTETRENQVLEKHRLLLADQEKKFNPLLEASILSAIKLKVETGKDLSFDEDFLEKFEDSEDEYLMEAMIAGLRLALKQRNVASLPRNAKFTQLKNIALTAIESAKSHSIATALINYVDDEINHAAQTASSFTAEIEKGNPQSLRDIEALLKTAFAQPNTDRVDILIDQLSGDMHWPYLRDFLRKKEFGTQEIDFLGRLDKAIVLLTDKDIELYENMKSAFIALLEQSAKSAGQMELSPQLKDKLSPKQQQLLISMAQAIELSPSSHIPPTSSLADIQILALASLKNTIATSRNQLVSQYSQSVTLANTSQSTAISNDGRTNSQALANVIAIANINYEISLIERGLNDAQALDGALALLNRYLMESPIAPEDKYKEFEKEVSRLSLGQLDSDLIKAMYRKLSAAVPKSSLQFPVDGMATLYREAANRLHGEREALAKSLRKQLPESFEDQLNGLKDQLSKNPEWRNILRNMGLLTVVDEQRAKNADATAVLNDVVWAVHFSVAVSGDAKQLDNLAKACAKDFATAHLLDDKYDVLTEEFEIPIGRRKPCLDIVVAVIKSYESDEINLDQAEHKLNEQTKQFSLMEEDAERLKALMLSAIDTRIDISSQSDVEDARLFLLPKLKQHLVAIDQTLFSKIFRTKLQKEKIDAGLQSALLQEESWVDNYLREVPKVEKLEAEVAIFRPELSLEAKTAYTKACASFQLYKAKDLEKAKKAWNLSFLKVQSAENIAFLKGIRDEYFPSGVEFPSASDLESIRREKLAKKEAELVKARAAVTEDHIIVLKSKLTPKTEDYLTRSANAQAISAAVATRQQANTPEQITSTTMQLIYTNAQIKFLSRDFAAMERDEAVCKALSEHLKQHQRKDKPLPAALDTNWRLRLGELKISDKVASVQLAFLKTYLVSKLPDIPKFTSISHLQQLALGDFAEKQSKLIKDLSKRMQVEGYDEIRFLAIHQSLKSDKNWKTILRHHASINTRNPLVTSLKQQIASLTSPIDSRCHDIARSAFVSYLSVKKEKGPAEAVALWEVLSRGDTSIGRFDTKTKKSLEFVRGYLDAVSMDPANLPNIEEARKNAFAHSETLLEQLVANEAINEMRGQLAAYQQKGKEVEARYGQSDPTCLREAFMHSLSIEQAETVLAQTDFTSDDWKKHIRTQFINALKEMSPDGRPISKIDLEDKLKNQESANKYLMSKLTRLDEWMTQEEKVEITKDDAEQFLGDMVAQGAEIEDLETWINENIDVLQKACGQKFSFHSLPVMYGDEEPIVRVLAYEELCNPESKQAASEQGGVIIFRTPAFEDMRKTGMCKPHYPEAHFVTHKLGYEINSFPKESKTIDSLAQMPQIFQGFVVNNPRHPLIAYSQLPENIKQFATALGMATQKLINPLSLSERMKKMSNSMSAEDKLAAAVNGEVNGIGMASVAKVSLLSSDKSRSFDQNAFVALENEIRKQAALSDNGEVMIRTSRPPFNAWVSVQSLTGEIFVHSELEPPTERVPQSLRAVIMSGEQSQLATINNSKTAIESRFAGDKNTLEQKIAAIEPLDVEVIGFAGVNRKKREMAGAHRISDLRDTVDQEAKVRQALTDGFRLVTGADMKLDVLEAAVSSVSKDGGVSIEVWQSVFSEHKDVPALTNLKTSKSNSIQIESMRKNYGANEGQLNIAQLVKKLKQENTPFSILTLPTPYHSAVIIKNPKSNDFMVLTRDNKNVPLTAFLKEIIDNINSKRKTVDIGALKVDILALGGIAPPSLGRDATKRSKHARKQSKW